MTDLSGLGVPTLEWGEVFHMGIRVANLAAAQEELSDSIGVSWTDPATIPMKAWAPDTGYQEYDLTISFTREGPVHIELLYGSPGSYYDVSEGGAGLHHIGVWVDDVTKVNQDLVSKGYVVELAGDTPEKGYGAFTYVRSPGGVLFEPESGLHGSKERFDRWYVGGSLF
jgi:catechol 2,3-dioxygenase-like lactoylglutathione lyase family enzyme